MNQNLRENKSHGTKEYPYCQHRIQGVPYGFHFPVHWHEEMEIIYVRQGSLLVNVGGVDYDLHPGQVVLVNPRELHLMKSDDRNAFYYTLLFPLELISFQSADQLEQTVFQPLRTGRRMFPNRLPGELLTEQMLSLLESVVEINVQKRSMYQLETRVLLLRFFMEILRNTQLICPNEGHTGQTHRQLLEYIRIHYKTSLSLSELAAQFHMSPKYLSRYFKEKFQLTISDYIAHLRMNHARELLESTDFSVTEVAEQSGFSSVSFFIRRFTEAYGIAPGKWRREHRGQKDPGSEA